MDPGDVVAERFEIEHTAGAGGMGTVYRARDRHTGAPVALKTLTTWDEEHAKRFHREAQVLYELRYPRIVRYIAHGTTASGELFLAMEWLEGESLNDRLKRESLSVAESVLLGVRAAEAIAYAHQRGVVHRDLKPGNLFLVGGAVDRLKLLDFGLARISAAGRDLTQTGAMLGTPGYMAPEQARGEKDIDARTDVFALGCVLFRCVTGRRAFEGSDVLAVLAKLVLEEPPRLSELCSEVPPRLDDLVKRMLAKKRDARPPDGAAVLAELSAGLEEVRELGGGRPSALPPEAPASLTSIERRVSCAVLARPAATLDDEDATMTIGRVRGRLDAVRDAVRPLGGKVDRLLDGSLLVSIERGSPSEQAARAARCAELMHAELQGAPMALVAGRGLDVKDGAAMGEAIDRAIMLVRTSGRPVIRVDDAAAALLGDRFAIERDGLGAYLGAGHAAGERLGTLLGKPTACVGRSRELRNLESAVEQCVCEPVARAVLVTGRAGEGKSRLRLELLRKLAARGPIVGEDDEEHEIALWSARGDAMSAGAAFGIIAQLLRQAAGVQAGESPELGRSKLAAHLQGRVDPRELPRVAEFLGEIIGTPFDEERSVQLRAARGDPVLMGDQMRRAWEDWLAAECTAHAVLLVIEDLHWGDLPSVKFLDAALRHLSDRPLMVIGFARPEVHELFPNLWAERSVEILRLGPLTPKASEQLVRQVLGEQAPAAVVRRVVEQAAGNAFFLEELIRAVAAGQGETLPDSVLAMVQARLAALEPEARRVLRAASVFGQAFWRSALGALLGAEQAGADLDDWLGALGEQELVSRRSESKFPGEQEHSFRSALVREASYAMLTEQDRTLGHRLARRWLERAGEREAMVLAEHCERGAEPEHAAGWYCRAAEQALEGNDLEAALARAERAVGCGAAGELRGALRLLQAEARRWRGEFEPMRACAAEAMELLKPGSARWCGAAAELGVACQALGEHQVLAAVAGELGRIVPAPEQLVPLTKAAARVAMQLFLSAQAELGEALLGRIAQQTDLAEIGRRDPTAIAWIHQARAFRALGSGDPGGYLDESAAAGSLYEQVGDLRGTCNSRVHLGFAYLEVGDYQRAEGALREALAGAERMGLHNVVVTAKNNLGLALARLGKLDAAAAVEAEAIGDSSAQGARRLEGGSRHYLAMIHALQGRLDEAAREAAHAADLLAISPALRAHALATAAHIRLGQGSVAAALAAAREAMGVLESLGGLEEGESAVRLVHAEALYASGELAEAQQAVGQARDRLLARASKIKDPTWRESFLRNVPENARTLAWAQGCR
ncbi:MAG: protein kinase [Deltaproteobacteria bacterium]|nr:protein kinase [Deltaproteobacteria bacterium]